MPAPLKVLIVEDNPADAELLVRELGRAGFAPDWHRVDTETAYLARLADGPDLVLSDYELPDFSGLRALELLQQSGRAVPFILVSGAIGEDTAVAAMQLGAADYLLKDRLLRLGPAVTRTLAESRLHRERQLADGALRSAHAQMQQLLDHSPAVLYAAKLTGGTAVPYLVSANISRLLGFAVAECLTYDWWAGQVHPEDLSRAAASVAETVAYGASRTEYRLRHKEGHYRWIDDSRTLIRDPAGQPAELTGLWADITDRKLAEVALEDSLAMLRATLESTVDGILVVDGQGQLLNFNRKFVEMWRVPAEALASRDGGRVLGSVQAQLKDPDAFARQVRTLYTDLETETFDVLEFKDGRVFERHSQPQRVGGATVARVTCFRDVTERKVAEARLAETHRQLLAVSRQAGMAEFATGILHNVGNVLNSVNVASTCVAASLQKSKAANLSKVVALLREHEKDLGDFFTNNPKGRLVPEYLAQLAGQLAGEQAGALKELAELQKNIEHILDMVTVQQGLAKTSAGTEPVNVAGLAEDALSMNAGALARHDIHVIKEFEDLPPLLVDKGKVLQILVNLVRNAQHACATSDLPGKKLTISISKGADLIRLAVRDNGSGISAANLSRIFTHGFTTKTDGHGFGLHSCALAAKELGGSLTVSSDGPGRGATFVLELPCPTT